MAWLLLIGAGLLEIIWAIALKYTGGFTRFWPSIIGIAYAVWVGIGALGVALAGIVVFGESASPLRLSLLGLILIGIIGLKVIEG